MISVPLVAPLPVEITNATDWWQPYVPPLVGLIYQQQVSGRDVAVADALSALRAEMMGRQMGAESA